MIYLYLILPSGFSGSLPIPLV